MIGYDTETHRTTRGCLVPKVVCLTLASTTEDPPGLPHGHHRLTQDDASWQAIVVGEWAIASTWGHLLAGGSELAAHRAPFDLAVLADNYVKAYPNAKPHEVYEKHFEAIEAGRTYDTNVRELLLSIADGRMQRIQNKGYHYSLAGMAKRYLDLDISAGKKADDRWQLNFHLLDGVPLDEWPEEAIQYAMDDALYAEQLIYYQSGDKVDLSTGIQYVQGMRVNDELQQTKAAFALHLMACHGFRLDAARAEQTHREWARLIEEGRKGMQWLGLMDAAGKKNMAAFEAEVEEALLSAGIPVERTKTGKVSTKSELLRLLPEEPRYDALRGWGYADEYDRHMQRLGSTLKYGPGAPITSKPNVLVATGRCSWANPPYHQPPAKGNFRESHRARGGYAYVSIDYDQVELCVLAWILNEEGFGSKMMDAINSGTDLHCAMATNILNAMVRSGSAPRPCDLDPSLGEEWTYEMVHGAAKCHRYEALAGLAKRARKLAKVANFGLPGGMGAKGFVAYAKSWGMVISKEEAELLIQVYRETWPAMTSYFDTMSELTGGYGGKFTAVQYVSDRLRGDVGYTDGCNGFFQGLAADGIKEAAWRVAKEQLCSPTSSLYGSRTVLLLHDELIIEVPLVRLHDASYRARDILVGTMREYVPGVRISAEPAAMYHWTKEAETVKDEHGRLKVWTPEEAA